MTEKEKPYLTPKKGEVDPREKRRLVDEALKRRQSSTAQYYFFSLAAAKERWENGKWISSGVFQGRRKCYTHIRFNSDPPETFPDAEFVAKVEPIVKEDGSKVFLIDQFSGISEKMYLSGQIHVPQKDGVTFRKPDPMDRLYPPDPPFETEIGENPFKDEDE
jgi:hypothetical protein